MRNSKLEFRKTAEEGTGVFELVYCTRWIKFSIQNKEYLFTKRITTRKVDYSRIRGMCNETEHIKSPVTEYIKSPIVFKTFM